MNAQIIEATGELIDARLRNGDTVRFTIPTASMSPLLAPGDRVSVRRARSDELRVGDVVIVKREGSAAWLAHRLIARRRANGRAEFVTKGDHCAAADPVWTETQLCGIVIAVWRAAARAPTDWRTRRARWIGALLACISRSQARAGALPAGWRRRVMLRVNRVLMQSGAHLARWVLG